MSYADILRAHAADPSRASSPFLLFEDTTRSFAETLREASAFGQLLLASRDPTRPFHVGLLLDNRPEFVLTQLGAGLCGAVIVGLNPTRRGEPLAGDIAHADCQIVLTEDRYAPPPAEAPAAPRAPPPRVLVVESSLPAALAARPTADPAVPVGSDDLALLVFTSGTTGGPKAVQRTHGKLALLAHGAVFAMCEATSADVV